MWTENPCNATKGIYRLEKPPYLRWIHSCAHQDHSEVDNSSCAHVHSTQLTALLVPSLLFESDSTKKLKPDIPSAPKHTDPPVGNSDHTDRRTLCGFFSKISHEEKVEANKREFEWLADEADKRSDEAQRDKEARLLKVQADGKKRQQVYRDKKWERKIAGGREPKQGKVSFQIFRKEEIYLCSYRNGRYKSLKMTQIIIWPKLLIHNEAWRMISVWARKKLILKDGRQLRLQSLQSVWTIFSCWFGHRSRQQCKKWVIHGNR